MGLLMWLLLPAGLLMFGFALDDEHDHFMLGALGLGMIACLFYLLGINPWTIAKADWIYTLKAAGIYIGIGILWSMLKVYGEASKLEKDDVTDSKGETECLTEIRFDNLMSRTPKWIALWPASAAWSLVSNWLREFFVWVADLFGDVYKKIFMAAIARHLK